MGLRTSDMTTKPLLRKGGFEPASFLQEIKAQKFFFRFRITGVPKSFCLIGGRTA